MLTSTELEKAKTFWEWFTKNRFGFEFMSDIETAEKNKLINACTNEVKKVNSGLHPIFCPEFSEQGGLRLIISAAGQPDYFQQAKDMAALAPKFSGWNIMGLIPPISKGMQISFTIGDIKLDPEQMGVALADVSGYPNHLAILVGLHEFDSEQPELMLDVRDTISHLISNLCGEEMVGNEIQFMEVRSFPDDPEAEGYYKMYRLPELIKEYRKESPTPMREV